jgi:signal transduction histidine kinase
VPMGNGRVIGRWRRGVPHRLVVLAGLAGFVGAVYVLVVLGGGMLIGHTDSPSLPLSVLATAAVALLFAPVQAALDRAATRIGLRSTTAPYDVLSRFSETVTGGYATEELPARMSMLLAQGTGAQWAQVWLSVAGRLTLAATWPASAPGDRTPPSLQPNPEDATADGRRTRVVRHGSRTLGVLRLQERPGLVLTSVEERLFTGLAAQAGLALRRAGLLAELEDRHAELLSRAAELTTSRDRLIATQDVERRRLERDMHDGAQQHLVALTVNLRLAERIAVRSPGRVARLLSEQADAARDAIEVVSLLSRGIYPRLLSSDGLIPALRAAVATSPTPVIVDADGVGRLPAAIEAALYFCCMEAVQNAAEHADAGAVTVRVSEEPESWRLVVTDDGIGFDQLAVDSDGAGGGLMNMRDRLDSVRGTLTVDSLVGRGTTVVAVVARIEDSTPGRAPVPAIRPVS